MIFVTLDKLYGRFNKILLVSALHIFHDNFIFYDFKVPDWNSVLPIKQEVVVNLVKRYLMFLFAKKSNLSTVSASILSRKYLNSLRRSLCRLVLHE